MTKVVIVKKIFAGEISDVCIL